jgi:sugar lactone lactonase YvrE
VTDLIGGKVFEFDTPTSAPHVVATISGKGGGGALALDTDGTVLVGSGADARVLIGDLTHPGAVSKLDLGAGTLTQYLRGFSAADGLAIAHDGTLYATNDFGAQIGRVLPGGSVEPAWAKLNSANGAALSKDDRYLYVSRTFVNPGVSRIPVDDPKHPQSLLNMTGLDTFDAPDGLTLDSQDRPVVPANALGQILRINAPGQACRLASGLPSSSVVVYGKGETGFATGHLYRAGFDGKVYEIPSAFDAGA